MATTQRPVRSMLHPRSLVETPDTEPLPLYTPRISNDPETASIISEAPTYRSDAAPPYSPAVIRPLIAAGGPPAVGLPYRRYAPGFQSRARGSVGDLSSHSYNMANWSTVRDGPIQRQYQNVANRRLQREVNVTEILNSLAAVPAIEPSSPTPDAVPASPTSASGPAPATPSSLPSFPSSMLDPSPSTPYSPSEDPALVGEAAASAARSQRMYREGVLREPVQVETKSWDFMLIQMRDWELREQSWKNFRKEVEGGRRAKLARRIGLRRR